MIKPESDTSPAPPFDTHDMDPAFKRLMAVYEQARTEYLVVAGNEDNTTISAAKFVRDTVENVIDNLKEKNIDADKQAELRTIARMAKDTVEKLCGGKKRKFDRETEKNQRRPTTTSFDRSRYPTRDDYPYDRREWRNDERRYDRERSPIRSRGYTRDRSPERVRIPYGYSRPVDTYYPA